MKIKVNSIEIPEENPFDYDKLSRKEHIEILTNFFESHNGEIEFHIKVKNFYYEVSFVNGKTGDIQFSHFPNEVILTIIKEYSLNNTFKYTTDFKKDINIKINPDTFRYIIYRHNMDFLIGLIINRFLNDFFYEDIKNRNNDIYFFPATRSGIMTSSFNFIASELIKLGFSDLLFGSPGIEKINSAVNYQTRVFISSIVRTKYEKAKWNLCKTNKIYRGWS